MTKSTAPTSTFAPYSNLVTLVAEGDDEHYPEYLLAPFIHELSLMERLSLMDLYPEYFNMDGEFSYHTYADEQEWGLGDWFGSRYAANLLYWLYSTLNARASSRMYQVPQMYFGVAPDTEPSSKRGVYGWRTMPADGVIPEPDCTWWWEADANQ